MEFLRNTAMAFGSIGTGALFGSAFGKFVESPKADAIASIGWAFYALAIILLLRSMVPQC